MQLEIVYVEDNPAEVFLLFDAIRKLGPDLRLTVVPDGQAAIAFLDSVKGTPCVIVLDLGLPKIDGVEVFKAVKNHRHFHDVPIVIFAEEPERRRVRKTGHEPDLFLRKPMDLKGYAEVAEQIVRLCQAHSKKAAGQLACA